MLSAQSAIEALTSLRNPTKAAFFPRFFKCGPGEYGEGDVFLGVTVPQVRSVAKIFRDLPLKEISALLRSSWHEVRLLGLLLLVGRSRRADAQERLALSKFYLRHIRAVNNWDLVDCSAPDLVGRVVLEQRNSAALHALARSGDLWKERIAVVATLTLIKAGKFGQIRTLAKQFLTHKHDLMHKAVGWMLREMGKRDEAALKAFVRAHAASMPRTMLRYAIERIPSAERRRYLDIPRRRATSRGSTMSA